MNASSSSDQDTVDRLAEEFAARCRRGEDPDLAEYTGRFPQYADQIRDLFPALVLIEQVKPGGGDSTGISSGGSAAEGRRPEQLGDYRILREVGRGGMGVVYEAEQESLGRRVALKVLPRHTLHDDKALARFRREARAAARLHHTNIVPVFEVGQEEDVCYYAMQFISGQGLDLVIDELRRLRDQSHQAGAGPAASAPRVTEAQGPARDADRARRVGRAARSLLTGRFELYALDGSTPAPGPPLEPAATVAAAGSIDGEAAAGVAPAEPGPVAVAGPNFSAVLPGGAQLSTAESSRRQPYYRSVARIGQQVAGALAYAHDRGVVHRDIKPSNLLLDAAGVVWITDFGLAKADEEGLTNPGDILGTLRYMAPERFRGEADGRADVYALGLTLYELLTLRPAFGADDRMELIEQVKTAEPTRPRALDPRIPRDLETIVQKAIDKDPGRRYQAAGDLAEDLRRFVADEPIRARRVSLGGRLLRWGRRHKLVAGLSGAVGALLVVLAIGSTIAAIRFNHKADESLQRLVRQYVSQGSRLTEEGDLLGALPWFAEALKLDRGDSGREEAHRLRLASVVRQSPRLVQAWFHKGSVTHAALSRDGRRAVTAGADGMAQVWDIETNQRLAVLPCGDPLTWAAFSPNGHLIVTATGHRLGGLGRGEARVWDVETSQPNSPPLKHSIDLSCAAFSPDGLLVVTADQGGMARMWDAVTWQPRNDLTHDNWVGSVAFSPDGQRVLTIGNWSGGSGKVWNTQDGHWLYDVDAQAADGHAEFSPDGRLLVTAGRWATRIWDAKTGARRGVDMRSENSPAYYASFSSDCRRVVTASKDGSAQVWDVETCHSISPPFRHGGSIAQATFSPDGRHVLTASADGTARVWNAATGEPLGPPLSHGGSVARALFCPDGRRILTASADGTARIWDMVTAGSSGLHIPQGDCYASFNHNGRQIVTSSYDGSTVVRDAITGLPVAPSLQYDGWSPVNRAVFSRDNRHVLTSNSAGIACVWDLATGRPITPAFCGVGAGWDAAFSPDGRSVVVAYTGESDGTEARIWDVTTGRLLRTLKHARALRHAEFSHDGRLVVTASEDRTARIWGTATGPPLAILQHDGPVRHAEFSPCDGRLVVTASADGTARVWETSTGQLHSPPLRHRGQVNHAAFSPDGRLVVTASDDQTARIWDAATGRPGPILKHGGAVHNARFRRDGLRIVTASSDGTARVWDAATGLPLTVPLDHSDVIQYAWFSPDGRRLLTVSVGGDGTRVWTLDRPDLAGRPVEDLMLHAQLLSGQTIDERGGSSPVEVASLFRAWERLRSTYPEDFRVTSEEVLAWHRRQAEDCARGGQLATALSHLDHLVATDPSFWPHHADRGNILARMKRYGEAAADFARAIDLGGNHWGLGWRLGLAHLEVGDMQGYRRACETVLARDGRGESPFPFSHADLTGLLAPGAVVDPVLLVALAERACAIAPRSDRFLVFPIAALYRAGRYEQAIQRADRAKAEGVIPVSTAWPFLAMAYARLGRHQEAREWLDKSKSVAKSIPLDGTAWDQRLTLEIPIHEAEGLLTATHSERAKEQPARANPDP